jgi:ribosomal protein L11 methyltransferase
MYKEVSKVSRKEVSFDVKEVEIEALETHLMLFEYGYSEAFFSDFYVEFPVDKETASFHLFLPEEKVQQLEAYLITSPFGIQASSIRITDDSGSRTFYTQSLKPFWLTESYLVDPFVGTKKEIQVIRLKPGKAFGIGDHPTTRMAAQLLIKYLLKGMSVIDVGCGTGILSIIASKLGAKKTYGFDIESVAIEEARENAINNGSTDSLSFICQDYIQTTESYPFDLLVSNIYAEILLQVVEKALSTEQASVRYPKTFIMTGILKEKWKDFNKVMMKSGLVLTEKIQDPPWMAGVWKQ